MEPESYDALIEDLAKGTDTNEKIRKLFGQLDDPPSHPPIRCSHEHFTKTRSAQWVYGTPGTIPARYRCNRCKVEWDVIEAPPESQSWSTTETKGPQA